MDSLLTGPMKIVSLFPIFFQSWYFTPFPSAVDVFARRQGDSCLYCALQRAAVNLQGRADQANLGNN